MYIEMKTFKVNTGFGEKIVQKFSGKGPVTEAEGFREQVVLSNVKKQDFEEVICMTCWETKQAYTAWKTSPAHQNGHKNHPKEKPDYIIDVTMAVYEALVTKSI